MTPKQKLVFDFIDAEIKRTGGVSPSYREIARSTGIPWPSGVARIVEGLVARGFLRKLPHCARSFEVLRKPDVAEIAATAPRRQSYTSFRFDDHLKSLVEHRKFTSAA